jgi:hypothetical protein
LRPCILPPRATDLPGRAIYPAKVEPPEEEAIRKLILLVVAGDVSQRETWLSRLEQAAEHYDSSTGYLILGMIFNDEIYAERNLNKSAMYFKRSAELGVPVAQYNVGALLAEQGEKYEAMCWLMKAIYGGYDGISSFDEFTREFSIEEVTRIEEAVAAGDEPCEVIGRRFQE